jgi:hypothetical protein
MRTTLAAGRSGDEGDFAVQITNGPLLLDVYSATPPV